METKKENKLCTYEQPEAEMIEIATEKFCGLESTIGCPSDSDCSQNEPF